MPPSPQRCHALLPQEYVQRRRKLAFNTSLQQVERQTQAAGQQDEVAMQCLQQDSALPRLHFSLQESLNPRT